MEPTDTEIKRFTSVANYKFIESENKGGINFESDFPTFFKENVKTGLEAINELGDILEANPNDKFEATFIVEDGKLSLESCTPLLAIDKEDVKKIKYQSTLKYGFICFEQLDDNETKLTFSAFIDGGWEQNLYCAIPSTKLNEVSNFIGRRVKIEEMFPLKVRFFSDSDELVLEADDIRLLSIERKDLLEGCTLNGKPYRLATPDDHKAMYDFIAECSGHDLREIF